MTNGSNGNPSLLEVPLIIHKQQSQQSIIQTIVFIHLHLHKMTETRPLIPCLQARKLAIIVVSKSPVTLRKGVDR